MEKSGSFSQKQRITRNTDTQTTASVADNAAIHQKMQTEDAHYHAEKLDLGGDGTHEGWIKAEEERMATKPAEHDDSGHKRVALAAYYLAEKRGFAGDEALADWLAAEVQIADQAASGSSPPSH